MKRDVNAFRERFNRWKLGDKVYESGRPLPAYEGGKDVRPVTTGGAGYIPSAPTFNLPKDIEDARLRLYNQVSPAWGFTDDTIEAAVNTILYNKNAWSKDPKNIIVEDPYVDGVWAEYLQIPEKKRRSKYKLVPSDYKPTMGNANTTYFKVPIDSETRDALVKEGAQLPFNKNKLSTVLMGYNHGEHTIGKGIDNRRGEYISYYDRWDINPFSSRYSTENKLSKNSIIKKLGLKDSQKHGDLTFGLGSPLNFYDRIYLDDYYGIDSSAQRGTYYGGWLPELEVYSLGNGFSTNTMGNYTEFGVKNK